MPVADVSYDVDTCTITITAEFAAPVERIWEVYADPRQLEQVWGPPRCPATFVHHDLRTGSKSLYFMESGDGARSFSWRQITAVDEPHSFAFDDGFATDDTFTPADELPVSRNVYVFEAIAGGTRATFTSTYDSVEALQWALDRRVDEGTSSGIDEIDGLVSSWPRRRTDRSHPNGRTGTNGRLDDNE